MFNKPPKEVEGLSNLKGIKQTPYQYRFYSEERHHWTPTLLSDIAVAASSSILRLQSVVWNCSGRGTAMALMGNWCLWVISFGGFLLLGRISDPFSVFILAWEILNRGHVRTFPLLVVALIQRWHTVCGHRMAHRKWKETKLQPGTADPGNMLSFCLLSFHFL